MAHNKKLEEIVQILRNKTNVKNGDLFFRILTIYKIAQMATMLRVNIEFAGTKKIPLNVYALNLAESGFSKGMSINILEDNIFHIFKEKFIGNIYPTISETNIFNEASEMAMRFNISPEDALFQLKKIINNTAKFQYAFPISTLEGLRSLRLRLAISGIGSTCMETDEIGSVLTTPSYIDSLSLYLETYDMGKGKQKLIKTDSNPDSTHPVPSNLLMFGTPVKLFDGDTTEKKFIELLETGYARRLLFGYIKSVEKNIAISAEELYRQMVNSQIDEKIATIAKEFGDLATEANYNKAIRTPEKIAIKLLEYKLECEAKASKMKDYEIIKKTELEHRYWKALKIAGLYAFIENFEELTEEHLDNAITLVEESGVAFENMMARDKPHVRLANYIASKECKLTQADLIEELPFYRGTESARREMLNLAISYGYQNGIIIKKFYIDNIEFFQGNKLEETKDESLIVSISKDITSGFKLAKKANWAEFYKLTTAKGLHYCNHEFLDGYRKTENAIPGFNLLILDVDNGLNIETFKTIMSKYQFLISTTKRHTKEHNRYRVIMPMTHKLKLNPSEYKSFMENVAEWLPFEIDKQTFDIARKWETFPGEYYYNIGEKFPCMDFISNTKKSDEIKKQIEKFGSLDSLQRWFIINAKDGSRNNMLLRYAFVLLDKGYDSETIMHNVEFLNSQIENPLDKSELQSTIYKTIVKEEMRRRANGD